MWYICVITARVYLHDDSVEPRYVRRGFNDGHLPILRNITKRWSLGLNNSLTITKCGAWNEGFTYVICVLLCPLKVHIENL